jgi:hypothetical protein
MYGCMPMSLILMPACQPLGDVPGLTTTIEFDLSASWRSWMISYSVGLLAFSFWNDLTISIKGSRNS